MTNKTNPMCYDLPPWCRYVNTFSGEMVVPYRTKKEALAAVEIMVEESDPGVSRYHRRTATYTRKLFVVACGTRAQWRRYGELTDDRPTGASFMTQYLRFWWFNRRNGDIR
jgi:hypothetical protein